MSQDDITGAAKICGKSCCSVRQDGEGSKASEPALALVFYFLSLCFQLMLLVVACISLPVVFLVVVAVSGVVSSKLLFAHRSS